MKESNMGIDINQRMEGVRDQKNLHLSKRGGGGGKTKV